MSNNSANNSCNNIEDVLKITNSDMQLVNTTIRNSLDSHVVLIKQISTYIINSGGKRLRPILV
ncbi:MAG: octaprenyl diphosphate synthase, partial [Proteobacteria bacterium]|nr:octaprenyl diphosphate synthase [Pseudomonadota bacterium]